MLSLMKGKPGKVTHGHGHILFGCILPHINHKDGCKGVNSFKQDDTLGARHFSFMEKESAQG
jgi:hypothetical protein